MKIVYLLMTFSYESFDFVKEVYTHLYVINRIFNQHYLVTSYTYLLALF